MQNIAAKLPLKQLTASQLQGYKHYSFVRQKAIKISYLKHYWLVNIWNISLAASLWSPVLWKGSAKSSELLESAI